MLGLALGVGSWVGLGRPHADEARELAQKMLQRAATPPKPPPPEPKKDDDERAVEFGPLPQQRDPSLVPTLEPRRAPWPNLNPDASISKAWMVAEGPDRSSGKKLVTLTFDDGPFLETTPSVLRALAKYDLHATFFVIGEYLDGEDRRAAATRRLLKKIVDAGHLVGNHTRDHAPLGQIPHAKVIEEIDSCSASIERAIGKKPILFRPPFGELDDYGSAAVRERGLDVMLWSIAVDDMNREDSHRMFREIVQQLERNQGGMILLHDIRFPSIAALRELLAWLKVHKEYEVVDMPTYLAAVDAHPLPYANRDELNRARASARISRR